MADKPSFGARYLSYRPSKTLWFWSCVLCVAATMIVGFFWAGWVSADVAKTRADDAARHARAQLAASYCVSDFEHAPDVTTQMAALKKTEAWNQDDFITKGGWVTPPGHKTAVEGAADLCVQKLLVAKLPTPNTTPTHTAKADGAAG